MLHELTIDNDANIPVIVDYGSIVRCDLVNHDVELCEDVERENVGIESDAVEFNSNSDNGDSMCIDGESVIIGMYSGWKFVKYVT